MHTPAVDQSELQKIAATPVGRRWLLKAGGAGLLATALGSRAATAQAEPPTLARRRRPRHRREIRDVFLALGDVSAFGDFTLRVAATDYPVRVLTADERRALRRRGGLFSVIDLDRLTHLAPSIPLSVNAPSLLIVLGRRRTDGRQGVVCERMSAPRAAAVRVARAGIKAMGSPAKLYAHSVWLRRLGVHRLRDLDRLHASDFADLDVVMDSMTAAAALVNVHPEVLNLDATSAAITNSILLSLPEIAALGETIAAMQQQSELPYWMVEVTDPVSGQPATLYQADGTPMLDPKTGKPAPAETLQISPKLDESYGTAIRAALDAVKGDPSLEGSTYYVTPADAPAPTDVDTLQSTPTLSVQLSRTGWNWGTQVVAGSYDVQTKSIALKFYNNWERLLQVHVQYFADKATQLAVDNHDQDPTSDQGFRSTPNSEYLTYVSDMPTSYGIPWALNQNYTSATITFPDDANYARILMCGPGSAGDTSQWHDYMNNDSYPGKGYPDECQWPLILTWVFDIGVPTIMLGFDAAIGSGEAISAYKSAVKYGATATKALAVQAVDGFAVLGDLGAYLKNSQQQPSKSASEAMAGMALAVTTLLWGAEPNFALFAQAAALVTAMIIEWAAIKAIPVMGQVFGCLAAAGDLALIATSVAEMTMAPWVVDCDVRLTYAATVTLKKDPKDATWPRAAGGARWTLQVITDGTDRAQSVSGSIEDGASADIVVPLPAVAISKNIQYTLRVTDGNANLIGKGQTDVLTNNDVNTLPTNLTIVTTELFKPITSQTKFVRQDTLQYNPDIKAYHWTPNVAVTATRTSKAADLLELDASTVGTVSGMVGSIWRSNDANKSFWVRNTPDVENNNAGVKQQLAGPYTQRPFIVYDRLNPDLVNGNNFFLEPQSRGGYLVRRLILSPNGGALTWQAGQAWGRILQDLTAVTYHPYGFIVGINAVTGKLQKLQVPAAPVSDSADPTLSQLHAGTGMRAGLTMSPVDLCCTLDGIIIVLEAGANRMQAFDVNGSPVQYFGSGSEKSSLKQMHGSTSDTRLSIGVDGSGYLYVLSYTGSGSAPSNYRVDVYKADGTFIVAPTGINSAAFDVDYWRNLFALNYAVVTATDGTTPYTDPTLGRVQPSLSIFVPSNPAQ